MYLCLYLSVQVTEEEVYVGHSIFIVVVIPARGIPKQGANKDFTDQFHLLLAPRGTANEFTDKEAYEKKNNFLSSHSGKVRESVEECCQEITYSHNL